MNGSDHAIGPGDEKNDQRRDAGDMYRDGRSEPGPAVSLLRLDEQPIAEPLPLAGPDRRRLLLRLRPPRRAASDAGWRPRAYADDVRRDENRADTAPGRR